MKPLREQQRTCYNLAAMNQPETEKKTLSRSVATRYLANVAIQVGCFTFVIVFGALLAGLWLDRFFASNGMFVILLILASIPLTWIFIFWLINRAKNQIKNSIPGVPQHLKTHVEEDGRGNS
jgi:F0F1-type ATP synthase assembly protein I